MVSSKTGDNPQDCERVGLSYGCWNYGSVRKEKNGGYVLVVAVPGILLMDNDKIEHHLKYLKYEYEGIILIGVMQDFAHQIYICA